VLATSVPDNEFDLVAFGARDELQIHVDVFDVLRKREMIINVPGQLSRTPQPD
jgi:hypothetical protein